MAHPERLYYADSFLTSFSGTVLESRPAESEMNARAWQVRLDRSAFYPTSGGQPFDMGELLATAHDGSTHRIPVTQVEEDEEGAVWHYIPEPLSPGAEVEGRIDWERRFDHMQQHTGQHLLSAVFLEQCNAPTVSFHLGEAVSTIDIAADSLATETLARVERLANQIIAEDRPVAPRYVSREQAESMLSAGHLRKLPDREGTIRLVEISGCDLNACGGTHVRSTGQIGSLLLRRTEKVTRGTRVEFVCGMRAVRTARADAAILAQASALLSTGSGELPAAITRLLSEEKTHAKEKQKLREELAEFQARQIASEAPVENGIRLVVLEWSDRDREFVRLLASRTASAAPATIAVFTAHDANPARVFLARSRDLEFHCGHLLRDALASFSLRGGGSPDLAQGDIPADQEPALRSALVERIRAAALPKG